MLILWIFLGSAILFFVQRAIYAHAWAKGVRLFLRFERSHAAAGEDVPVYENRYFGDNNHMNRSGAEVFTAEIRPKYSFLES